jgi:hypothetical protein
MVEYIISSLYVCKILHFINCFWNHREARAPLKSTVPEPLLSGQQEHVGAGRRTPPQLMPTQHPVRIGVQEGLRWLKSGLAPTLFSKQHSWKNFILVQRQPVLPTIFLLIYVFDIKNIKMTGWRNISVLFERCWTQRSIEWRTVF